MIPSALKAVEQWTLTCGHANGLNHLQNCFGIRGLKLKPTHLLWFHSSSMSISAQQKSLLKFTWKTQMRIFETAPFITAQTRSNPSAFADRADLKIRLDICGWFWRVEMVGKCLSERDWRWWGTSMTEEAQTKSAPEGWHSSIWHPNGCSSHLPRLLLLLCVYVAGGGGLFCFVLFFY